MTFGWVCPLVGIAHGNTMIKQVIKRLQKRTFEEFGNKITLRLNVEVRLELKRCVFSD